TPAIASAASVQVNGDTLTYAGGDDEINNLSITLDTSGNYVVADTGTLTDGITPVTVTPGPGCNPPAASSVTCPPDGIKSIKVTGGGQADQLLISNDITLPADMDGGAGDDTIYGGGGPDIISGGD